MNKIPYLLVAIIVLFPTYHFGDSAREGQKVLFLIMPIFMLVIILLNRLLTNKYIGRIKYDFIFVVLLISGVIQVTTIISKVSFLEIQLVLNHFRLLAYSIVYLLGYNIASDIRLDLYKVKNILFFLSLLSIVFVLVQLFFPSNVAIESVTNRLLIDYTGFRIGGPFVWSYISSFMLLPVIFLILFQMQNNSKSFVGLFVLLVLLVFILLSQSKAAYLGMFVSIFFYILILYKYGYYRSSLMVVVAAGTILSISLYYVLHNKEMFSHILMAYEAYAIGDLDVSSKTRLNQFLNASMTLNNNFMFGTPLDTRLIIENAYVHYFYYYGILGLMGFIIVLMSMLIYSYYSLVGLFYRTSDVVVRGVAISIFLYCLLAVVFSLSSSPIDAHKSSYLFFIILSFYFSAKNTYFDGFVGYDERVNGY